MVTTTLEVEGHEISSSCIWRIWAEEFVGYLIGDESIDHHGLLLEEAEGYGGDSTSSRPVVVEHFPRTSQYLQIKFLPLIQLLSVTYSNGETMEPWRGHAKNNLFTKPCARITKPLIYLGGVTLHVNICSCF